MGRCLEESKMFLFAGSFSSGSWLNMAFSSAHWFKHIIMTNYKGTFFDFQNRDDGQPTYNVIDVWGRNITGAGVVVAVVDIGLDPEHPEIKANYVSETVWYCRFLKLQFPSLSSYCTNFKVSKVRFTWGVFLFSTYSLSDLYVLSKLIIFV